MRASLVLSLAALAGSAYAQSTAPYMVGTKGNNTIAGNYTRGTNPDKDGKFHIQAEGIRAYFIPYGASISNLFINDSMGIERDIVLGFDNATYYTLDGLHPHLGAVPGRYANRIKNSTFSVDGNTYHILPNEHDGADTLHGGPKGWDWRNWTVVAHTTDSITFSLVDPDGDQGFPGEVVSYVTYTVTPFQWHIQMMAKALTKTTPIMLSSHVYWNLDGFQNPSTPYALNHTFNLPYSGQKVATDGILIPTGEIDFIAPYSVNDFYTSPKQIGANFSSPAALGNCGTGCVGYDTCFLVNREAAGPYDWREKGPVATLYSNWSGISVNVFTDQEAFQMYSCGGMNGTMTLKNTQGLFGNASRPRVVEQHGCVVMEVEDWIDGINYPAWGRESRQVYGPGDAPYVLQAIYKFSAGEAGNTQSQGYGMMGKREGRPW